MTWMKLATAALGIATVVLAYVFVPAADRAELVGIGMLLAGLPMNFPGTASVSLKGDR